MPPVNPLMVMLARESAGLTQTALAEEIGVKQGTLSKWESGEVPISPDVVPKLAQATEYPESLFFEQLEFRQLPLEFYRRRVKVPAATLKAIRARANFARMHVRRLLQTAEIPDLKILFRDTKKCTPGEAARELRLHWHIPPGPVANLVQLVEDAGILLIPFDFESDQVDGLSLYDPRDGLPPMIFYSATVPPDRLRMTLAHEVAHIILHHHLLIPDENADTEREAFEFAGELLMPAASIRGQLAGLNLRKLAALKLHWKVSMQALIMRAFALGRITDRQRGYLFAQMNKLGYRAREPVDIPQEKPSLLAELIDYHLRDLQYTEGRLSGELHLLPFHFRRQYRSLAAA